MRNAAAGHPPDLAQVVRRRRDTLGWTRADLAARAGMSPAYVDYVEDAHGRPSASVLRRLADALGVPLSELTDDASSGAPHGAAGLPPQAGPPTPATVSPVASKDCLTLLASVPVGRVAFVRDELPQVLPVNFSVLEGEIVVQTAATSQLARLAREGAWVSFEADDIDELTQLGWSVLCQGPVRLLAQLDRSELRQLQLRRPWPNGGKRTIVVINPQVVTGRRLERRS